MEYNIESLLDENKKLKKKLEYARAETELAYKRAGDAEEYLRRLIHIFYEEPDQNTELIKLKEELRVMYTVRVK